MEKFIRKYWLYIMFVFAFFIMFGTVSVQIDTFENSCPKGPIIHETDKIALEMEKAEYINQIEALKEELYKCMDEKNEIASTGADNINSYTESKNHIDKLNKQIEDYKSQIVDLNEKVQKLNGAINNLENTNKEMDKELKNAEIDIKTLQSSNLALDKNYQTALQDLKQPIYTQFPNMKRNIFGGSLNLSLKECQDRCSQDNDCTAFNYFNSNNTCNIITQLSYKDIMEAKTDEKASLYFKNSRDQDNVFDINKINLVKTTTPMSDLKPPEQEPEQKQEPNKNDAEKAKIEAEIRANQAILATIKPIKIPFSDSTMPNPRKEYYEKKIEELEAKLKKIGL